MTDDRIISLASRRSVKESPIIGVVSCANDRFRIPFMKVEHEPRWTVTAQAEIQGEGQWPIDASFAGHPLDEDTPKGWVTRGEHSLSAEFVVGPEHIELIRQVAVSPVPFEILVAFSTDDEGAVRDLTLSVNRKTTA